MPVRIQRKRSKGWRMPDGAVFVGRPTAWGNPAIVRKSGREFEVVGGYGYCITTGRHDAHAYAVEQYRKHLRKTGRDAIASDLRGKDLACWCPLDMPCHADVLLEIANASDGNALPRPPEPDKP